MKKSAVYLVIIFALISCGNEPPSISFPTYNILIYQAGCFENILNDYIYLSIYFILNDENGFEDIKEVKITHIDTEYSWIIKAENLSKVEWNDKTLSGFSFIEIGNAKKVLLGDYHIEVLDKSDNLSDAMMTVDPEGYETAKELELPEIKYQLSLSKDMKQLTVENDTYSSCEIKFVDNPAFFNGGRKKFASNEKIILNNNKPAEPENVISVRINKDLSENLVYFLKPIKVNSAVIAE